MPSPLSPIEFIEKTQTAPAACLIYGSEIQLVEEVRDFLYRFFEKENIERHYWKELNVNNFREVNSDSLFASNKGKCVEIIIEKSLGHDSGGDSISRNIQSGLNWLLHKINDTCSPDMLIINIQEWDDKTAKTAWFKKLSMQTTAVFAKQLSAYQSKKWINRWVKQFNIQLTTDAIEWLSLQTEGNLLAAKQTVQKLELNGIANDIDVDTIRKTLADGALFDVFDLINAICMGNLNRSLYILQTLQATGTPTPIIMWALNHIIINLLCLKTGESTSMWGSSLKSLQQRVKQYSEKDLIKLLRHAAFTDRACKGVAVSHPITLMIQIVTNLVILGDGDKIRLPMFRE